MKCLSKDCKCTGLLMTVELCYPCSQIIEHQCITDANTLAPYIARIAELEAQLKVKKK
jgi:hypothetical protein